MLSSTSSTPSVWEFDPRIIPYQYEVIEDIEENFDYSIGAHELLLSGSVGSAKSILLAHLALKHVLRFSGARVAICRRAMPDLRLTIWRKILEHLEGALIRGKDYVPNLSQLSIAFRNGSEIISQSWADGIYTRCRSLELSAAIFEELTENDDDDKRAYDEMKMRVGRLPHVPENWIASATNPDSPSHWAYKYFIMPDKPFANRHVYYSVTTDNPFLPPQYIESLKEGLDPKMAERMIYGRWVEIQGEVIYYAYDHSLNYRDFSYEIDQRLSIHLTFDFNIADGKPMSMAMIQYRGVECHVFNESVIHSANTSEIIEDIDSRGLLKKEFSYVICGDASGKHRDTRSKKSDYSIISEELSRRGIRFEMRVPLANPPVRTRHNKVNAKILNANGFRTLWVYKDAKTADEGFRLTKLKDGARYIEDDSKPYQHITTAIGYDIVMQEKYNVHVPTRTTIL